MENSAPKIFKKPTRPALGRGLSALISAPSVSVQTQTPDAVNRDELAPTIEISKVGDSVVSFLPISGVQANPDQPRQIFPEAEIAELAASIKAHGVLQPILVRPIQNSTKCEIVAGERRFRAAQEAGLSQVPVIIKDLLPREALEIAIVENVQRQNLTPIEEARSYQRLMDEFSQTAQEIAEKVGKDRASIANIVRVLKLPELVQEMLNDGRITLGHAKAILTVKEPAAQIGLAKKVEDERLSVRALEAIVAREVVLEMPKKGVEEDERLTPQIRVAPYPDVEERLRNALGTKVSIRKGRGHSGVVELHFHSEDELNRIIEIIDSRQ